MGRSSRWMLMVGDVTWLGHEKRPGVSSIGALMIGLDGSAPVDENGFPFQALVEYDEQNQGGGGPGPYIRVAHLYVVSRSSGWILLTIGGRMFETKQSRGTFLVVVAGLLSVAVAVTTFVSERTADEQGTAVARSLASELAQYETFVDVLVALQSGELDLPPGASVGTGELRVVAWQEVRTLMAVRCARVMATADGVSAPLEIGEPSVEERPCGR